VQANRPVLASSSMTRRAFVITNPYWNPHTGRNESVGLPSTIDVEISVSPVIPSIWLRQLQLNFQLFAASPTQLRASTKRAKAAGSLVTK
jgi:hypothetical protein